MNHENFLNEQFPLSTQTRIVSALKKAYRAIDQLVDDIPLLQVTSAQFNHGRLKSWASDYYIEALLKDGLLPYEYRWEYFDKPTGKFLRIHLPDARLIISQVSCSYAPPRFANFRANAILDNQPFLFPEMEMERQKTLGTPTFILVHGHKDLSFVRIGLPHPSQQAYIFQTDNLLKMPHIIEADKPQPEAMDTEGLVTLKEEIFKQLVNGNA